MKRSAPSGLFLACASAVVPLAGCAHDPEYYFTAVLAAADVYETPPPPAPSENEAAAEAVVVPTQFAAGPLAIANSDGPYLLDTGDRLRVFIYGQPNLSRAYTVDHDGKITVPLIGSVEARGRTTEELQRQIRQRLATQYVRDPQVTVDILQNRPFFILGEVRNSGAYPFVSGMTVETAIALAGGYTERASSRSFRITRRINGFIEQVDVPIDYVVQPGDTVFVYERFF
jgi:polysaccharide export outer membrane protein